MPSENYHIFDFDRTLTIRHTFSISLGLGYSDGKANAKVNMKKGVNKYFMHDTKYFSAVATYHNNVDFVAGFVAEVLKTELTFVDTLESNVRGVSINRYSMTGREVPIFISYINPSEEYEDVLGQLTGKNDQILSLRRILLKEGLIEQSSILHFYDDSVTNFNCATKLPQVRSYLIQSCNTTFCIEKTYLLGEVVEAKPHSRKVITQSPLADYLVIEQPSLPNLSSMNPLEKIDNPLIRRRRLRRLSLTDPASPTKSDQAGDQLSGISQLSIFAGSGKSKSVRTKSDEKNPVSHSTLV